MGNIVSRCRNVRTTVPAKNQPYLRRRLLTNVERRVHRHIERLRKFPDCEIPFTSEALEWSAKNDWRGFFEMLDMEIAPEVPIVRALDVAARHGCLSTVKFLINHVDKEHFATAALNAAFDRNIKILALLRKKSYNIVRQSELPTSFVSWIATKLHIQKANTVHMWWGTEVYNKILLHASSSGNLRVVKLAVRWGATSVAQAMFDAAVFQKFDVVKLLIPIISEKHMNAVFLVTVRDRSHLTTVEFLMKHLRRQFGKIAEIGHAIETARYNVNTGKSRDDRTVKLLMKYASKRKR